MKGNSWILFVGVLLLLIGIYAFSRTIINMVAFPKYPNTGVLSMNFSGAPPYSQREEDCIYSRLYYKDDGQTTRPPTVEEKAQDTTDEKKCLSSVAEGRETAKVNDISQSTLFLFLGIGVLLFRKFFLK